MKRTLYSKLLKWKISKDRKPLILRGARQVGKTYLLKNFGKNEYKSLVYINFEETPLLSDLFKNSLEPKKIIANLSTYLNKEITPQETLLILDEIQECPEALNALKYFQEQSNEFHVAAAGSLLGVQLRNQKGFPVGKVNFLDLYPLNFFEFLLAMDKKNLYTYLQEIEKIEPLPESIHLELLSILKSYFYIGGMPEAVFNYIENQSLAKVRTIQEAILDGYLLDFAKHASPEQIIKITQVWELAPVQLAKENKKFIFSAIKKSARGREYETAIQWLNDAGLIIKAFNIETPKLPLNAFCDKQAFKVFLLDVGLLACQTKLAAKMLVEKDNIFSEFYGSFTENFACQTLTNNDIDCYYWTSNGKAEIDFILECEGQIFPLEVKAGVSKRKKSLNVYNEKYQPPYLLRSSLMNLRKDHKIINIPLYLLQRLPELIAKIP